MNIKKITMTLIMALSIAAGAQIQCADSDWKGAAKVVAGLGLSLGLFFKGHRDLKNATNANDIPGASAKMAFGTGFWCQWQPWMPTHVFAGHMVPWHVTLYYAQKHSRQLIHQTPWTEGAFGAGLSYLAGIMAAQILKNI